MKAGIETFTIDNDFTTNPDWCEDMLNITSKQIIDKFGTPDIIWASPPCTTFSVASLGHHWTGGSGAYIPKTEECKNGIIVLKKTIRLIKELNPKYYFIENPRGVMRKMSVMQQFNRYTVTYCQYGDTRMKPTDIWTNHPNPNFKPACKNGDKCHVAAPRGSKTGTQGLRGARERGVIPEQLCEHILNICTSIKFAHS
jgi:site-specific DNA-cytosine methylase